MAISNLMIMEEIQRLQTLVNGLAASIVEYGERAVALETWRNGHDRDVHTHLREQIAAAVRVQERQGEQLWKVALQVANLVALVAAITNMAGMW